MGKTEMSFSTTKNIRDIITVCVCTCTVVLSLLDQKF